jgi:hypothetical protein
MADDDMSLARLRHEEASRRASAEIDGDEPVLLHEQDLMLALLHVAAEPRATLDAAAARLRRLRRAAGEADAVDEEVMRRLERATEALRAAGALAKADARTLKITDRGRELLAAHPEGVDETVLMQFPEYRAFIAVGQHGPRDDPRIPAYDAGQRAFAAGEPLTANPFALDSVDHLAWENGWSEARDEAAG